MVQIRTNEEHEAATYWKFRRINLIFLVTKEEVALSNNCLPEKASG